MWLSPETPFMFASQRKKHRLGYAQEGNFCPENGKADFGRQLYRSDFYLEASTKVLKIKGPNQNDSADW